MRHSLRTTNIYLIMGLLGPWKRISQYSIKWLWGYFYHYQSDRPTVDHIPKGTLLNWINTDSWSDSKICPHVYVKHIKLELSCMQHIPNLPYIVMSGQESLTSITLQCTRNCFTAEYWQLFCWYPSKRCTNCSKPVVNINWKTWFHRVQSQECCFSLPFVLLFYLIPCLCFHFLCNKVQ